MSDTPKGLFTWFGSEILRVEEDNAVYERSVTFFNFYDHPIVATRSAYDTVISIMVDELEVDIYQALSKG
jgi:hypothetical protein